MTSRTRRGLRSWSKRALLATLVGGVLFFGLRANGAVAERLATIDESVWLVDPPKGVLVRVNALAGDVTSSVKVAAPRQQLSGTQFGSGAIVLNRSTGALGRVDGSTLAYQAAATMVDDGTDLALVGNDAAVFAVDTSDGRLVALDAADLSTRYEAAITANQPVSAVVDAAGRLWAYDATLGEVIRFDGANGDVKRAVVDPSASAGLLTLVKDEPVLISPIRGEAVRLKGNGSAGQALCLGGDGDGPMFAVGSPGAAEQGHLFALSAATGDLWTTDVATNRCVSLQLRDEHEISDAFGQPVAHADRLFVPVLARAEVLVINGADNSIERTIDLSLFVDSGNRFELFVDAGRLWFNDLDGSLAGVLSRLGPTLVVDKVQQRSYSGAVLDSPDQLAESMKETGSKTGFADNGINAPITNVNEPGGSAEENIDVGLSPMGPGPGSGGPGPGHGPSSGPGSGAGRGGTGNGAGANASAIPAFIGPAAVGAGPDRKPTPSDPVGGSGALQANFTYSPPGDPTTETRLFFVDTSVGRAVRWQWSFTAPDRTTESATGRTLDRTLAKVGLWSVTLTVTDAQGNEDTTRPLGIQVRDPGDLAPPNANFTWDPATPVVRAPVQFRDRSTTGRNSPVTSWFWEFGDGSTSSSANPSAKAYASAGRYTVRLTVANDQGVDTAEAALTVAGPPSNINPDFEYADADASQAITAGEVVFFTDISSGGPTSWQWDFGDGSTATGDKVGHQFRVAGDYRVRLNVANSQDKAVIVKVVRVSPPAGPPVARIGEPAANVVVEVDRPVRFVSASTGNPTQELWDWGDGTRGEGASALKSFTQPGLVVVRLTASNAAGSTTDSLVVTVLSVVPPQVLPSFRTTSGTSATDLAVLGQPVRFVNTSTGVGTFSWSFGDGSASQERDPDRVYGAAGTYHVTLTMTNGTTTATAEGDVYVGPAPVPVVANFDWLPRTPRVGLPVQFTDRSTGTPARWSWNFGDGSVAVVGQVPPAKVYNLPGRYDVTLTVVDRTGAVSTKTLPVVVADAVRPAPVAAFTVTPSAPAQQVAGRALVFTDATLGGGAALSTPEFTIEATQVLPPAGSRSVEHVFTPAGTYPVSMRVCWADDPTNCDVEIRSLTISPAIQRPVAAFTATGAGVVQGGGATVLLTQASIVLTDASTGGATSWAWTVGGVAYTGRTVTVTVSAAGPVTITLTATNITGSSVATRDFVAYAAPEAAFTVSSAVVAVGEAVQFTDLSIPAPAIRTWNFGDGSPPVVGGTGVVDYIFTAPGTYSVSLSVNLGGRIAIARAPVTVVRGPTTPQIGATNITTGAVSVAPSIAVALGDVVQFADVSTGPGPSSRAWTWSDAAPGGAGATVQRTFGVAGTYTLTLVSTNALGPVTASMVVVVTAPPPTGAPGGVVGP